MIKKIFALICTAMLSIMSAMAQETSDHSSTVTMFRDFQPAIITLNSGMLNRQKEANIFLKNSALVYKKGDNVMEANMDMVRQVKFGDRVFTKVGKQLAEVIDSCGTDLLVLVRVINMDGLKHEMLNNSTITNLDLGEVVGVTRMDATEEQVSYTIDNNYYFIVKGKSILCHERNARQAAGRKRMEEYERVTKSYGFSWTNRECLMNVLKVLRR